MCVVLPAGTDRQRQCPPVAVYCRTHAGRRHAVSNSKVSVHANNFACIYANGSSYNSTSTCIAHSQANANPSDRHAAAARSVAGYGLRAGR